MARAYEIWAELFERVEAGEVLSSQEQLEFQRLSQENPACRRELQLLEGLRLPDASTPSNSERRLVRLALEAVRADGNVIRFRPQLDSSDPGVHSETAPPRSHRRGWALAAAGAVACAAMAVIWLQRTGQEAAGVDSALAVAEPAAVELTLSSGMVSVDGVKQPAETTRLAEGNTVSVVTGRACLLVDSTIDMCLVDRSEIRLKRLSDAQREVELVRGRAVVALSKQAAGLSFGIVAGSVRAVAIGTIFSVESGPTGVEVSVLEGAVEIHRAVEGKDAVGARYNVDSQDDSRPPATTAQDATKTTWVVRSGQRLTLAGPGEPRSQPVSPSEAADLSQALEGRGLWHRHALGRLTVSSSPVGARVGLDGVHLGVTPLAVFAPAGNGRLDLELEGHQSRQVDVAVTVGHASRVELDLSSDPAPLAKPTDAAAATVTPQSLSAEALLKEARGAMHRGQWRQAAGLYSRLRQAFPGSPEAHTVLVTLGQLQLDRLGQPGAALRSFEGYLKGGGSLVQEARLGKIRALRALGSKPQERSAIREYLTRHPSALDNRDLRRRLEELGTQ